MSKEFFSGKWTEAKGEIRKMWGDLTDDDLERTKGNMTAIGGLIEQRYGEAKDSVSRKLDDLSRKFSSETADASERAKESLRESNEKHH